MEDEIIYTNRASYMTGIRKNLFIPSGIGLLVFLYFSMLQWLPMRYIADSEAAVTDILILSVAFCVLLWLGSTIISLVLFIPKRTRGIAFQSLAISVLIPYCVILGYIAGFLLRQREFKHLVIRGEPIVTAILTYEEKQGELPSNLNDLVPGFLKNVPSTGVPAFPDYLYKQYLGRETGEATWRLEAYEDTSHHWLDLDNTRSGSNLCYYPTWTGSFAGKQGWWFHN